jgi:integrase
VKTTTGAKNGKQKRGQRGAGYLYKRGGAYWLEYKAGGERVRCALKDADGNALTTKGEAEAARKRIVAPLLADDKAEAERQILARLQSAEMEANQARDAAHDALLLSKAWDVYRASTHRPDSGPRTFKDYQSYWLRFVRWAEGKKGLGDVESITKQTAKEYAQELLAGGCSANTYNKHTAFLRLFFSIMVEDDHAKENPFRGIRARKLKTHSRRELTIEELRTILDRADGELALLLGIGTFTGLRLGDCASLQWGEVDLDRHTIRRVPNKSKGRTDNPEPVLVGIPSPLHERLAVTPPKHRCGPVCPKTAALYEIPNRRSKVTREIQAHFLDCGIDVHAPGTGDRIARNPVGTPERDASGKVKTVRQASRAVVEVGFHSLRHTYVSLHAERGTPQAVIQALVGHGNPAMTRHYTHIGEAAAVAAANALPAITGDTVAMKGREPIPDWAMELIRALTVKNVLGIKSDLLEG